MGGLANVAKFNEAKAKLLYDVIDNSEGFYDGHAKTSDRSVMNVVFKLADDEAVTKFLEQAANAGMTTLKGHRSLGGIRASIYNAMPMEGVESLVEFMKDFASKNG